MPHRYCCPVLRPLDPETGRPPEGEYEAEWGEHLWPVGWNARRLLLDELAQAVAALAAAGCRRIWVNGSLFVTAKEEPADFDPCWDSDGVDLARRDAVLLDLSAGRPAKRPSSVGSCCRMLWRRSQDFFQNERDTGRKGIVVSWIGDEA